MSLGVIFCVWLLFSVATGQICSFQVYLEDSGADGWNGNQIQVQVNGVDVGFTYPDGSHQTYATVLFGSEATFAFNAHNGDNISVAYVPAGRYPTENSFQFGLTGSDDTLFSGQGSDSGADDQFTASCCCVPGQISGLTLQSQSPGQATINWNDAPNATVYRLFRKMGANLYDTMGEFSWAPEGVTLAVESDTEYHVKIAGGNTVGYGPMSPALNFHSLPVSSSCTITLVMLDAFGDGWGDGYVDVYVNDAIVLHATSTSDRAVYTFQVPSETVTFSTDVATDAWPEDKEYALYRGNLELLYSGWGGTGPNNLNAVLNLCSSPGLSATKKHLMEMPKELEGDSSYEEEQMQKMQIPKELFANGDTCTYRITVNDAYGDGWGGSQGSYCTISTRNTSSSAWNLINSYIAVSTTQKTTYSWTFSVVQPQQVEVNWYAGHDSYPTDDSYGVYLITNGLPGSSAIISSPANPTSQTQTPVASQTFTSSCGSAAASCSSITNCPSLNRNPCQSTFSPPTCGACLTGFTASGATNANTQCNDINECASSPSPCSANAQCANNNGGYTCTCNSGYTGNGVTCTAVTSPPTGGCSSTRLRLEWFDQTNQVKDRYIRAIQAIYSNGGYTYFPNKHQTYAYYAHGYAPFLSWHRSFLWEWENAIRALGGEWACTAIPYFDWTNSANIPAMFTSAKTSGYYTGMMAKNGALGGAFSNFVFSGSTVTRASNLASTMPQAWTFANSLRTSQYSVARPTIEAAHNNFHVWVGGTMNIVAISPRDPVFFVHHANVDQQWAAWEYCNGYSTLSTQAQITGQSGNLWESASPYSFTATMPGYTIPPWRAHNIQVQYGYSYSDTFLQRAFNGGTSLQCPNTQTWFTPGRRRLLQNGPGSHPMRGHYVPPPEYVVEQQAIFEKFKDSILNGDDLQTAFYAAVDAECALQPNQTEPYVVPLQTIIDMGLEQLCAAGACANTCWQRTNGRRN